MPHILAGAAIATRVSNPAYGFIFAFLSHYLLDFIPHWEYSIKNIAEKHWRKSFPDFLKIVLDSSAAILIITLFTKNLFLAFAGGFFAILPDGFAMLYYFFPKNRLLEKHHNIFHTKIVHFLKNEKISLFWRIFFQTLTIFISFLLIK